MSHKLSLINDVLTRVKIHEKAGWLYLVANVPVDEIGTLKRRWFALHVQNLENGLAYARVKAFELENDLIWERYTPPEFVSTRTASEVVIAFRKDYRAKHQIQDQTWEKHWQSVFRLLPQDQPISAEHVLAVIHSSAPDTRQRRQQVQKLQALCKFAGLELDLAAYRGKYGQSKTKPLNLPTDEEVQAIIDAIPNPCWRRWIGLQCTYGLRAHEPQFVRFNNDPENSLRVLEGKTQGRDFVPPLLPQWVERWDLRGELPNLTYGTYVDLTHRCATQFRRYRIPFPTRTMRYAWLIRAMCEFGYPIPNVAKWAGHSEVVLLRVYSRYISASLHAKVYRRGLQSQF